MSTDQIPVTRTSLPKLNEFIEMIKPCWETAWLTNNGPLVQRLELELTNYLKAKNLLLVSNGTIALQLAIKALNIKKEVITTPFSYVATTSAILWENCKPVFVDVDEDDLCIDVKKIEEKITKDTEAILAVHVYGNPCDVNAISALAQKYNLKVIYDAAHAFNVEWNNEKLTNFGDISTLSFHSTKLFHSIEGGAMICPDTTVADQIALSRAFGHRKDHHIALGINAKMNEIQAAMGICNLPNVAEHIVQRKKVSEYYDSILSKIPSVQFCKARDKTAKNYSYYPILLKDESTCMALQEQLQANSIITRRYFYPALNTLPYVDYQSCPVAEDVANRVLCLPLYSEMDTNVAEQVMNMTTRLLTKL